MISDAQFGAFVAGALVATFGLWWFRLVMKNLQSLSKSTRLGIYALVWLAYFVVTLLVIAQGGASL